MSRDVVQIANPRRYGETHTGLRRAQNYCNRGLAYWLRDGRLKFRDSKRAAGDAYVDPRGVIWWNGARSLYVNDSDIAMFPPGCNVSFPKGGTVRAARRFT